jgi:hypothetical protein
VDRSDSVSSLDLGAQHPPEQGQCAEASNVPEAWLNVQQGGKTLRLLVGSAPTIDLIGALANQGFMDSSR